jgi:hypothetical protein
MTRRYTIPITALTVLVANLAAGSAFARPPPATDCSGVLQCITVTAPPESKSPGIAADRPYYKDWHFQPRGRDDRYPRSGWYRGRPPLTTGVPF